MNPGANFIEATFDSMTLPNLDPEISDITLYRYNDATDAYDILVGEDDVLERDEVVQARCTIRNRNTAASAGLFHPFSFARGRRV